MKNKLLSIILCVVLLLVVAAPVALAKDGSPDLTLDFNKRYTDIFEADEVSDPYLDLGENKEEKEQKRDIYVVVLVVLLVIAVAVFIYTLRKVPAAPEEESTVKKVLVPKSSIPKAEKKAQPNIADEEKAE